MAALSPADEQILMQVSQAIRARDVKLAATLAERAFATGLRHPLLFNARALWFGEQERSEDALADFRRAQAMSPPNVAIESAIGVCLVKLDRPAEAIEAFEAAIALDPGSAQLHCKKGWAHEMAQDAGGARRELERAIELQPDFPEALGRLAYLAARRGEWDEARKLAETCLGLDTGQAVAQLAKAMSEIETGALDEAHRRLSHLLARQTVRGVNRSLALGLLGDLCDRQGRTDEAFALYESANSEFQKLAGSRAGGGMSDAVSSLITYFEKRSAMPRANPPAAADRPSHIFLLGFPRSGTTLIEQIFASHPGAVTLEEKDTLADAVGVFMARPQDLDALFAAGEQTLASYRDLYWQRVKKFGADPQGKAFIDKTPINTVKLPVIARIFPDAKIVFALRDPRDVVFSCFRRQFDVNVSTSEFLTLDGTAQFYDGVMRLAELYRAKLPLNLYRVRHEDLVGNFDAEMQRICAFTGLPWDEAMRDFARQSQGRSVGTPSAAQLARGLNREGIGQWRRYSSQLAPVLPILKPWVERFGYPVE